MLSIDKLFATALLLAQSLQCCDQPEALGTPATLNLTSIGSARRKPQERLHRNPAGRPMWPPYKALETPHHTLRRQPELPTAHHCHLLHAPVAYSNGSPNQDPGSHLAHTRLGSKQQQRIYKLQSRLHRLFLWPDIPLTSSATEPTFPITYASRASHHPDPATHYHGGGQRGARGELLSHCCPHTSRIYSTHGQC